MADVFKYPNGGYDVVVCRKQDILDCIDDTIVDKDVALAVIEQCEFAAAGYIKENRWTGIPFIGNIRVPKNTQLINTPEQQSLIKDAREVLDKESYILFRRQLNTENTKHIKFERYYKYITSIYVNKNKALYRKLCKTKGEVYARLYCYSLAHIVDVNKEYIIL